MNINDPTTSRILAILIQNIEVDDRTRFRSDAEKARSMEMFIKNLGRYKTNKK